MLANMMGTGLAMGWIAHFMIGTVVWGIAYAMLYRALPSDTPWLKGVIFGIGAWLMMMIAVMPMAGAGFFRLEFWHGSPGNDAFAAYYLRRNSGCRLRSAGDSLTEWVRMRYRGLLSINA